MPQAGDGSNGESGGWRPFAQALTRLCGILCVSVKQDNKSRDDDALVFRIAQLFIGERAENLSPTDIAEQVTREFHRQPALSREMI